MKEYETKTIMNNIINEFSILFFPLVLHLTWRYLHAVKQCYFNVWRFEFLIIILTLWTGFYIISASVMKGLMPY